MPSSCPATAQEIAALCGHESGVITATFSADGAQIAVSDALSVVGALDVHADECQDVEGSRREILNANPINFGRALRARPAPLRALAARAWHRPAQTRRAAEAGLGHQPQHLLQAPRESPSRQGGGG
jgi:hypothetical protein